MEINYSIEYKKYKKYRPTYGKEIYEFIEKEIADNKLAWDCACGSGQATEKLANIFNQVMATDIDSNQISNCKPIANVRYLQQKEQNNILQEESVDFISVATGIHWLNIPKFYKEANRVLKNKGVLGVWGYTGINIHPDLDIVLKEVMDEFLMPFYPSSVKIAFNKYKDINLPFTKINSPNFFVERVWSFTDFKNYLLSFTAMQNYKALTGECGFYRFEDKLLKAWGEDQKIKKKLTWEIITNFSRK